jgi:hypothetical protein
MRVFDDQKILNKFTTKKNGIKFIINLIYKLFKKGEIKDILVIARTTDETPGPTGLPQNVINWTSVDTEYEATVFNRFASDLLFDIMKKIAIKEFIKMETEKKNKGAIKE